MHNFNFYNPTRIEFGIDKEDTLADHIAKDGIHHVLICYGSQRIKNEGLFEKVTRRLVSQGISWCEFGGIISNPVISSVRSAVEMARKEKVQAIISIGGGSVLDSAKAIAAGVDYPGDAWELFTGDGELISALPIYAILTLAATGSEMNPYAVVVNEETKEKLSIGNDATRPRVTVLNPALMTGVPREYLVYSAADIISHLIEVYFTATVLPRLQSRLIESLIKTVIETTDILINDPQNIAARGEFAWASTLAQNGITFSGAADFSYPNHAIEHSLSALFDVPHGAGMSVVMPAWMKWYQSQNKAQFNRFARVVFNVESAEEGIAALESWFTKIGTPVRLSEVNISAEALPSIIDNVKSHIRAFGIAETYSPDVVEVILQNAL